MRKKILWSLVYVLYRIWNWAFFVVDVQWRQRNVKKKRVVVILIYQLDEFYSCTCFIFRKKPSTFYILSENNPFISKRYLISPQHNRTLFFFFFLIEPLSFVRKLSEAPQSEVKFWLKVMLTSDEPQFSGQPPSPSSALISKSRLYEWFSLLNALIW